MENRGTQKSVKLMKFRKKERTVIQTYLIAYSRLDILWVALHDYVSVCLFDWQMVILIMAKQFIVMFPNL
jgi:hypothetical protein